MSKFTTFIFGALALVLFEMNAISAYATNEAYQLPDRHFEDWSGDQFDGNIQPLYWHYSNVTQFSFKFNFSDRQTGRSGYALKVADKSMKVMGIDGGTSPGYVALGYPWAYVPGLDNIAGATAGTYGGIAWTHRPDTLALWIKRQGDNALLENYNIVFYAWTGTAQGSSYGSANGCTAIDRTDEESDIRIALDANTCGTVTYGNEVCEAYFFERAVYDDWVLLKIPVFYMNDDIPEKCNLILSAGNYPAGKSSDGMYPGNSITVDDVELIYSSKIQKLFIGNKEWKGFDPNSTEPQTYSLGVGATVIPDIYAVRGAGRETNNNGVSYTFNGRRLSTSECVVTPGAVDGAPTTITVSSEDGESTTTYTINFVSAPSTNARLADLQVNGATVSGWNSYITSYNVALPYGTTDAPVVSFVKAEDNQTVTITQATSTSGSATISVVAPDKTTTMTYTINFSVAQLSDNTLQNILIDGEPLAGFVPQQTTYKVELPLGTTSVPTITPVSAYPAGEQTIVCTDNGLDATYTIAVTTPGNRTPKTYKLNFKITASSYTYLRDLQMGEYLTDFQPTKTTYYVNLPLGTTALPEISYTAGDAYQSISVEQGGLDGTTRITVTAANGDQTVYKIIVSTEKSSVSTLQMIYVGGEELPSFASGTNSYDYALPIGTTAIPQITWTAGDEYQTVTSLVGGIGGITMITVTAGDGTTNVYQIRFTVLQATDATLNMIYLDGVALEGFTPTLLEYNVQLPQGTTALPAVTYEQHDQWQTVTARSGGVNGDYRISVRPQSGAAQVYVIHFSVVTSSNTNLQMIYLDGAPLAGFSPTIYDYVDSLPMGVSDIPTVTYLTADASQKILMLEENTTVTIRVTSESGVYKVYTVRFIIQKSEDAFLRMIYLDGAELAGFDPQNLVYTCQLTGATAPIITVDKSAGQQVSITSPASTGTARILVTPESGASNTYSITFTAPENADAMMTGIYANDVLLPGFNAHTLNYTVAYSDTIPTITYTAGSGVQTVTLVQGANSVKLIANGLSGEFVYTVSFQKQASADVALRNILLDGVALSDFNASTLLYTIDLPAGSTLPAVTYEKNDASQSVVCGNTAKNVVSLLVTAENGASQTYTLQFHIAAYSDANLTALMLDGVDILQPETYTYNREIAVDAELPVLTYIKGSAQSTVMVNSSALQQQVVVVAEDGTMLTYTINYTEQTLINALLSDIRLYQDGAWSSISGFSATTTDYNLSLPRRSTSVPSIYPVAGSKGQTITVTYGAPDGATTIRVVAADHTEQTYTLHCSMPLSSNTSLGSLMINGEVQDVNRTSFAYTVPFGTVEPYEVEYTKGDDAQMIEYQSANINGTTSILVTAEDGSTRTYKISYYQEVPDGRNILRGIAYSYVSADGTTVNGSISEPTVGENIVELPYGAKSFSIDGVTKDFQEQSVTYVNGGIRRSSSIIVRSSRSGEREATYLVTPHLPDYDNAGLLASLTYQGNSVPHFRPDVYNYIVLVTAQPTAADFAYTTFNGESVSASALDAKKKQITFTVNGGKTYSVCWFYSNDVLPFDFSGEWVANSKNTGYKPTRAWSVLGDYVDSYTWSVGSVSMTYTTGKEILPSGSNGVMLSTLRGMSIDGSVPGAMTLGGWENVKLKSAAVVGTPQSTGNIKQANGTDGIAFRNTPEQLSFDYKEVSSVNITAWSSWMTVVDEAGNYNKVSFGANYGSPFNMFHMDVDLNYAGLNLMSKFNLTLNSGPTDYIENLRGSSGSYKTADLIIQDLHFTYNSALTAAFVDGQATTLVGDTFFYDAPATYVGVPALSFTGAVHDQTQTIEWLNGGNWNDGKLVAKVTNYGENLADNTVYYVALRRDAVTELGFTPVFTALGTTVGTNDTTFINLAYGTQQYPDFKVVPFSPHQLVTLSQDNDVVTITVENELGQQATSYYVFREVKSSDATLASIAATGMQGAFAPATEQYTVVANSINNLSFVKQSQGQSVVMSEEADRTTLTVTAEDGITEKTYTLMLSVPSVTTSAQLTQLAIDGDENLGAYGSADNFDAAHYRYSMQAVHNISFGAEFAQDAVVETLTDDSVVIALSGSQNHAYTLLFPYIPSSNTDLSDILVAGRSLSTFNAAITSYSVVSDTVVDVEFVPADRTQSISLDITQGHYEATVTAQNGATKTYIVTVGASLSSVATLDMIYVNGEPLAGFNPSTFTYSYLAPTVSPKQQEPAVPSISYAVGQAGQTVTVTPAARLGESATIEVEAEDGTYRIYEIVLSAEPSDCADLTAIFVNHQPIANFKAGRTFYSVQVTGTDVEIDYSTADRFQTVVVNDMTTEIGKTLTVTAQNGTQKVYEIEFFQQAASNNANLRNILLNSAAITAYDADADAFNEKQYTYHLSLNGQLPDVSAQLQEDGQTVEVTTEGNVINIHVTAEDGESSNDYRLIFTTSLSGNAYIRMIYLDGDSLSGFSRENFNYDISLPLGMKTLPDVDVVKDDAAAAYLLTVADDRYTYNVTAEDGTRLVYTLRFSYTLSDADTLLAVYEDEIPMQQFDPQQFYYYTLLPVGRRAFPDLTYDEADRWQVISEDTIVRPLSKTYQISVRAESGRQNVYTFVYEMQQSAVDTLRAIYVGSATLESFSPYQSDYDYLLPMGTTETPRIDYFVGDEYQTVNVVYGAPNGDSKIMVTAENGSSRIYTIHFSTAVSNNTDLQMITVAGRDIDNFSGDYHTYRISLPHGTTQMPIIGFVKEEEAQNVTISSDGWTATVTVVAEDGTTTADYVINFSVVASDYAYLSDLMLDGTTIDGFSPLITDYVVTLPYGTTTMPVVTYTAGDAEQTVTLENASETTVLITVVPGDEEGAMEYSVIFEIAKSDNVEVLDILTADKSLEGFSQSTQTYEINWAPGTDETSLFTSADINVLLADTAASWIVLEQGHMLTIIVTAQDGTTTAVYVINQTILLPDNNLLRDLLIDGATIRQFDPETFTYEVLLQQGQQMPTIEAFAQDTLADVSITQSVVGEESLIYVTAQNGEDAIYSILFTYADYNVANDATANGVVWKYVGDHQYLATTIYRNVVVVVYDYFGHRLITAEVPTCDPNDAITETDVHDETLLVDVLESADGIRVTLPQANTPYFYAFFRDGKYRIATGKFMLAE